MQLDTEHTDPVKPKSHHFDSLQTLSVPGLRANPAIAKDDLWDAIKASFDASEGPEDTVPTEPTHIFANVLSDETTTLLLSLRPPLQQGRVHSLLHRPRSLFGLSMASHYHLATPSY